MASTPRFPSFVFLALLLFLSSQSNLPALDPAALAAHWQWIRESPDEWQITPRGDLRLRTQPGQIWAGQDDARNILVRKATVAHGPASFEATVSLDNPVRKWEQAGLLVYVDDSSFIKFVVEYIEGDLFVVMAREHAGKRNVLAKIQVTPKTARLRLEVTGDQIKGLYQIDPTAFQWQEAALTDIPATLNRRFALFTQNGPADTPRHATFHDLVVTAPTTHN
jgi:regulation of enolase protein 1 (concanavalin A-like superfamily)